MHVHAPHDHEVEHQAHAGNKLSLYVAAFTAVLAAIAGYLHYKESVLQTQALLYKNEAVLKQAQVSDQWNYYQAKAQKQNLAGLAAALTAGGKQDFYNKEVARYEKEKKAIQNKASAMEKDVDHANAMSEHLEAPQHMIGRALALINVAISLAALTSLTGVRALFVLAGLVSLGGIVVAASAIFA
jgi:hypothetical protein